MTSGGTEEPAPYGVGPQPGSSPAGTVRTPSEPIPAPIC